MAVVVGQVPRTALAAFALCALGVTLTSPVAAQAAAGASSAGTASPSREAAIHQSRGHVIASGPGYSIVATSPRTAVTANQPVGAKGTAAGPTVTDATPERLEKPIVCQGQRVLRIDNRDLRFDGNAITAEDGCEVRITNSRISAQGVAIVAHGGSVHIENSDVEGGKAAVDATQGAQIYAEASHFEGAVRRVGDSQIHDLGNNTWD